MKERLVRAIKEVLQGRDIEILARRHGLKGYEKHTLKELSLVFDLTRERIRQIQLKAEGRLKIHLLKRHPELIRAWEALKD